MLIYDTVDLPVQLIDYHGVHRFNPSLTSSYIQGGFYDIICLLLARLETCGVRRCWMIECTLYFKGLRIESVSMTRYSGYCLVIPTVFQLYNVYQAKKAKGLKIVSDFK